MPTDHSPSRRLRGVGAVFASVLLAAGCATGERPILEPQPVVDDPAAAVVLDRLERAGSVSFTATYDIIPSTTGETTTATVRQLDGQRRVTIGDVDYVTEDGTSLTCSGATECADFIDDARVSDLNITHRFWGDAAASRLRIDAARRVGFGEGSTTTITDHGAACADVPVLGGTVVYCALDAGILARYFGADVTIELTSFTSEVDPAEMTVVADPAT